MDRKGLHIQSSDRNRWQVNHLLTVARNILPHRSLLYMVTDLFRLCNLPRPF